MKTLLTRDEFREQVFKRDNYQCVICHQPAQDAHHLLERRLWIDGGYYILNGVSVCGACHLLAEQTLLTVEELREAAGITQVILPEHLYRDQKYTKWGDPILDNGNRLRGELFNDESVQKVLAQGNVLGLYTKYVKYPRTYHLPWSPGASKDDRILPDTKLFEGHEVVVTLKLDGENSNLYDDYLHARSLEYSSHPSRNRLKQFHASIQYNIPPGWRLCAENVYARHSIHYSNLPAYFFLISIWNEQNICLSWDETKEWAQLFDMVTVPEMYRGPWDEKLIRKLYQPTYNGDECEGYVVRLVDSFHYKDFRNSVAKYVRAGHVSPENHHWKHQLVIPNKLKG